MESSLDRSTLIPANIRSGGASMIAVSDIDGDGDEDIVLIDTNGEPRLLRNEFGNRQPRGEHRRSRDRGRAAARTNAFGIGSRVELRRRRDLPGRASPPDASHTSTSAHTSRRTSFASDGPTACRRRCSSPARIRMSSSWEMLKGSCAFAYTWDGKKFRFVTDAMWRSALGMPGWASWAARVRTRPAGASQEVCPHSGRRACAARWSLRPAAHRRAVGDRVRR